MTKPRAFTLIEMLATISIILLLIGLVLPAMGRARESSKSLKCQTHLKAFANGWQIYADDNEGVSIVHRMYNREPQGFANPKNWYDVGNGLKYRPRWPAMLGSSIGTFAFSQPKTDEDRQDYDDDLYRCPTEPTWVDERNYAYGYNYQFLGNGRRTNDRFHNTPVFVGQLKATSGTVIFADSMGTAAGFPAGARASYRNDQEHSQRKGNHGYALDPPRLTEESDRGIGVEGDGRAALLRTAVDPRHHGLANTVFADAHVEGKKPVDLGYRITHSGGCYADENANEECGGDGGGGGSVGYAPSSSDGGVYPLGAQKDGEEEGEFDPDRATNRYFSGTGRDDDPPKLP